MFNTPYNNQNGRIIIFFDDKWANNLRQSNNNTPSV